MEHEGGRGEGPGVPPGKAREEASQEQEQVTKGSWVLIVVVVLAALAGLVFFATRARTFPPSHPSVKILSAAVSSRISVRTEPQDMKWLIEKAGWTEGDINALDFLFQHSRHRQEKAPVGPPSLRDSVCARILDEVTEAFAKGELDKARRLLQDDLVLRFDSTTR